MKLPLSLLMVLLTLNSVGQRLTDPNKARTVSFLTEDSIWVFADLLLIEESVNSTPILLLLHQSASNSEEYAPMIPSFIRNGFNCLAVDARGGGNNYGRQNRTNANLPHYGGGPQAYYDFKAAIKWLRDNDFKGKITIIGSSYSAGRMFMLLAEEPENVVAGASFSPGRAFARQQQGASLSWAEQVNIPIFISWSPNELNDERKMRFSKIKSGDKILFEQKVGVHGASTLRPDKNPDGFEENMKALLSFLNKFSK